MTQCRSIAEPIECKKNIWRRRRFTTIDVNVTAIIQYTPVFIDFMDFNLSHDSCIVSQVKKAGRHEAIHVEVFQNEMFDL